MSLPALSPSADIRSIVERVNRMAQEFNRTERKAPIIGTDTGTATAYAITPTPGIALYEVGQVFSFQATHANSGTTPTLNVNGKGAGTITYPDGTALVAGDIALNATVTVAVASTTPTFHLLGGNPTTAATQAQADNSTKKATTAYVDRVAVQQVVRSVTGAVATGTTAIPADDTKPQNTEGDQYMSLSITPKSATSLLLITVVLHASHNAASANNIIAALFQDSAADALAVSYGASSAQFEAVALKFTYAMVSGTTSATTFKVRAGPNIAATVTFNGAASARLFGGALASSIVIEEIGV